MSKSQISIFNNTGKLTFDIENVTDKYYEIKSTGKDPIYLNIEKDVNDEDKITSFIYNYTNVSTVVSAFSEEGVTSYINNDLIPTITKGKPSSIKKFSGNVFLLSLDITESDIGRVVTDKGCCILDYQITTIEEKTILNIVAIYRERDKSDNRMTILLIDKETGKKLTDYSFRFKGKRMLHLYKEEITRKKPYIINERDIRLRKSTPKNMSYNIVTTKNQMCKLKLLNKNLSKVFVIKNKKDVKYISKLNLKTITIYDPKGEIKQDVIDQLIYSVGNVYMYDSNNNKMHKM